MVLLDIVWYNQFGEFCFVDFIEKILFNFKVAVFTYITQEISLGPCIAPSVKLVLFESLSVYLYYPRSLTVTLHCPLSKIVTLLCVSFFSFQVSVFTYITQEVSLGPCIASFVKFVQSLV